VFAGMMATNVLICVMPAKAGIQERFPNTGFQSLSV
jgi:hypothetical protein